MLFGVVLLISFVLRFFQLGVNPPSLTWDEAAWGYNAYSLGIDARDEFGKFLPIQYLESFGDFKPPLYAYLDIIPIKIFGLTEFATRFPSALFGVLTVLVTYFLTKELFKGTKYEITIKKFKITLPLIASLILAVSPWHINLSRAAFEANVASFFIICGIWLFLKGIQRKPIFIFLSALSFSLSMYTFNTARIVSPLLIVGLLIGMRNSLFTFKKTAFIAFFAGFIILIPLIPFLLSPQASLRFKEVNIFSDIGIITKSNQEIANDNNSMFSKLIHNRRFEYFLEFMHHYFDNLNPSFLFIKGDGNPKFSTRDVGQMYIWDIPFFALGLLFLFRKKPKYSWIVFYWLIVALIPAGAARETPHALRIEASLPTFQIITALGVMVFLIWLKAAALKKTYKGVIATLLVFSFFFNVVYYIHGYYAHSPKEFSGEWQYGYKDAILYASSIQDSYDLINVSDTLGRPYMYYLFYTKTDPNFFRKNANVTREVLGFVSVNQLGKYKFISEFSEKYSGKGNTLNIRGYDNIPKGARILKQFNLLDGKPVLGAYTF